MEAAADYSEATRMASYSPTYGQDDYEETELSSALLDSENAYLQEQRAILQKIEEENDRKKATLQLESSCDVTSASSRSFTTSSSLDHTKTEDSDTPSPTLEGYEERAGPDNHSSVYDDALLLDDEDFVQENLLVLREIQGTQIDFTLNPISDDEVIREQMRIMQEIQAQATTTKPPTSANPTSASRSSTASIPSEHIVMFEEVVRYPKIPQGISMASFKDKAFSNKSTALYYQDRTLQLENGCKMRVKGTKHAYKSIEAGKAVLTQCASCGTVSQVDASCKALYCTHCEQITPVREMTPSDIDIARAVQSQEKEVSYLGK